MTTRSAHFHSISPQNLCYFTNGSGILLSYAISLKINKKAEIHI